MVDVLVVVGPSLLCLISTEGIDQGKQVNRALGALNPKHLIEQVHGVNTVQLIAVEARNNGDRGSAAPVGQSVQLVAPR